jgi:hypothetical protein
LGNDRWFNGFLWPVVWAPSLKSGGALFYDLGMSAKAPGIPTLLVSLSSNKVPSAQLTKRAAFIAQ